MEKEIKEDVNVSIKETPQGKIRDVSFGVNTMSSGFASFDTKKIRGYLEGIFISSPNAIQLTVKLEKFDITLFHMTSIQGDAFIPIRLGAEDSFGANFRDSYTKWALNDKLRFEVKGPVNSEVKFLVRYC